MMIDCAIKDSIFDENWHLIVHVPIVLDSESRSVRVAASRKKTLSVCSYHESRMGNVCVPPL